MYVNFYRIELMAQVRRCQQSLKAQLGITAPPSPVRGQCHHLNTSHGRNSSLRASNAGRSGCRRQRSAMTAVTTTSASAITPPINRSNIQMETDLNQPISREQQQQQPAVRWTSDTPGAVEVIPPSQVTPTSR